MLMDKDIKRFRRTVYAYYRKHGRDFPWRRKVTPYRVFVSEVMLQQTGVGRVEKFFPSFITRFPGWKRLAESSHRDVLSHWKGLGYNRRAHRLQEAARTIVSEYRGRLPRDPEVLIKLPGVGKNTAGSIAAFAYNRPAVFLETNIRTVLWHHFFREGDDLPHDNLLLPLVSDTLDTDNPRVWYSALMDYGAHLKRTLTDHPPVSDGKTNTQFQGSLRQARGKVLETLLRKEGITAAAITAGCRGIEKALVINAVDELVKDGSVRKKGRRFWL